MNEQTIQPEFEAQLPKWLREMAAERGPSTRLPQFRILELAADALEDRLRSRTSGGGVVRRWTLWFDVERGTEPPQVAGETPPGSRSGKRWGRPVEVVPLSEVREALLVAVQNEDAILDQRLADAVHQVRQASQPETLDESVQSLLELSLEITLEAALPSADSEGQG